MKKITLDRRVRRKKRVSLGIVGTAERPRISVSRSNRYIYAQAIDDKKRITVASCSTLVLKKNVAGKPEKKTVQAGEVGLLLAKLLKEKKVERVIFDRGRYGYHGRVRAFAEGLRKGGIIF